MRTTLAVLLLSSICALAQFLVPNPGSKRTPPEPAEKVLERRGSITDPRLSTPETRSPKQRGVASRVEYFVDGGKMLRAYLHGIQIEHPVRVVEGKTNNLATLKEFGKLQDWELMKGEVLSVAPSGLLIKRNDDDRPVLIEGYPENLVDGDEVAGYFVFTGRGYSYKSAIGASKTVRVYTFGEIMPLADSLKFILPARARPGSGG